MKLYRKTRDRGKLDNVRVIQTEPSRAVLVANSRSNVTYSLKTNRLLTVRSVGLTVLLQFLVTHPGVNYSFSPLEIDATSSISYLTLLSYHTYQYQYLYWMQARRIFCYLGKEHKQQAIFILIISFKVSEIKCHFFP